MLTCRCLRKTVPWIVLKSHLQQCWAENKPACSFTLCCCKVLKAFNRDSPGGGGGPLPPGRGGGGGPFAPAPGGGGGGGGPPLPPGGGGGGGGPPLLPGGGGGGGGGPLLLPGGGGGGGGPLTPPGGGGGGGAGAGDLAPAGGGVGETPLPVSTWDSGLPMLSAAAASVEGPTRWGRLAAAKAVLATGPAAESERADAARSDGLRWALWAAFSSATTPCMPSL